MGVFGSGLAPGEEDAGGHALDVPLEGTGDGLVEVVDVEDDAAIETGEGAEVADVGVSAELVEDGGVGGEGEIGGHDGDGSAEVAEGREGHALVLEVDEGGDAAAHGGVEELEGVGGAVARVPASVVGAAEEFAAAAAEGGALL